MEHQNPSTRHCLRGQKNSTKRAKFYNFQVERTTDVAYDFSICLRLEKVVWTKIYREFSKKEKNLILNYLI